VPTGIAASDETKLKIKFAERPDTRKQRPRLLLVTLDLLDERFKAVEL
jgi:hypothetical protein